jgi:branched-chain amino acid transport system substrate-binding protein
MRKLIAFGTVVAALGTVLAPPAFAQKHYGPGVSDTAIKIGQTDPFSGPFSVSGNVGKAQITFFQMINDQGGVNGRKIDFLTADDGYNPAKTVEQTRKLVEEDGVLLLFGSTGTPTEGRIDAKYILENKPDAKIAVLYQNDDLGKSFLAGLRKELGDKAGAMIVNQVSYEATDPTVDSQIISLAASNATVFADYALPKIVAQGLRKSTDLGWKPLHSVPAISAIP